MWQEKKRDQLAYWDSQVLPGAPTGLSPRRGARRPARTLLDFSRVLCALRRSDPVPSLLIQRQGSHSTLRVLHEWRRICWIASCGRESHGRSRRGRGSQSDTPRDPRTCSPSTIGVPHTASKGESRRGAASACCIRKGGPSSSRRSPSFESEDVRVPRLQARRAVRRCCRQGGQLSI